jgi:hypothetical protein
MAFNFSKFKIPGLFSQKEEPANESKSVSEQEEKISYRRYGFIQAGLMKGKIEGLKICLENIYEQHKNEMRRDEARQEELRKPYRNALSDLLTVNNGIKSEITMYLNELIPAKKKRIEGIKNEIDEVRRNPQNYTGAHVGKVAFFIGVFILVLLSVYLFIFYSSASYSAFFKDFKVDDAVITKAIFDADAIGNSLKDGATELIFILTIPFVFIGLGYLIHKFQELKHSSKYFKITGLLVITFIFDSIIAYEITEKIYNIRRENDITGTIPEYSFGLAFSNVGFWLIIFAGFVVYLIWGFVFDFVLEAHSKLDSIKVAIRTMRDQITGLESEIKKYEDKITEMRIASEKNNGEINKLKNVIDGTIILPQTIRESLSLFMVGWYNWLAEGREYNRSDHNRVYEEFVAIKIEVVESVMNPN